MSDKPIKIAGTFYWANFSKQNEMSGKYQFDFGNLSDKAVQALKDLGLNVATNKDYSPHITFKSTRPIEVRDSDGNIISDRNGVAAKFVSNGSKGIVSAWYYDWEFKNKKGRSPSARNIEVTELVEYNNNPSVEDENDIPV